MGKFKVGDKVKLKNVRGVTWNLEGKMDKYKGKIVTISKIDGANFEISEDDRNDRLFGKWEFEASDIESIANACTNSIHIYSDGTTTTAILKDGKETIRTAQAKCSPDDTYDFAIGAKLAFDRLMGAEVKEVKRKAKVGEWVKATEKFHWNGNVCNIGDIFLINHVCGCGLHCQYSYGKSNEIMFSENEYVVLENYKPEKPIEDKPLEVIINGVKYIKATNK